MEHQSYAPPEYAKDIFWSLRTASLLIAQSRQYELRKRMLILGMFIKRADDLLAAEKGHEIEGLSAQELERLESGHYDMLGEHKVLGFECEPGLILDLLNAMRKAGCPTLGKCIAQAMEGLGMKPDGSDSKKPQETVSADLDELYRHHLADKEYIVENIAVNHIYAEGFPFNYRKGGTIMTNFKELFVKCNMITYLLAGVCGHGNKFDKRKIVECVSSFSRIYDHHAYGALTIK